MQEPQFRELLDRYLLPMFPGIAIGATRSSKTSHDLAAFASPGFILMKPHTSAVYRVELSRSQPFTSGEKKLLLVAATSISSVAEQCDKDYFLDLMAGLPRRIIASFMGWSSAQRTLAESILQFETLAAQTYEGDPVVVALGITGSVHHGDVRLNELWRESFSAVLSNGIDSMYVTGSDGRVFNVLYLAHRAPEAFAPLRMAAIAHWSSQNQRIALVLNRNGELLIFSAGRLQFAKRRGAWRYYPHGALVKRLGTGPHAQLRHAIYDSCLDVSFARSGGCIALLSKGTAVGLSGVVDAQDLLLGGSKIQARLLASVVKKNFASLDRRMRHEMLALDGATILDHQGYVLAAGAIVNVPGGSEGGGRNAAALRLSDYGLGIKISADGPITAYRQQKLVMSI